MSVPSDLLAIAQRAQQSTAALSNTAARVRSDVIFDLAEAIKQRQDDILEANTLDLEVSREMAVPDLIADWLKLTPERLQATINVLRRLGETPDPLYSVASSYDSISNCDTYGLRTPMGTIALVYESFPELGAIAAGFSLRTGNVLILKGGAEASHSNQMLTQITQDILTEANLPPCCVQLVPPDQGDVLRELVTLDHYVNLVIPYGRSSLVQQVAKQATVPVLKTAIGNCYAFWSLTGAVEVVQKVIADSHRSEPDPVNAIEKVLVHRGCNSGILASLFGDLKAQGLTLKGDPDLVAKFPGLLPIDEAEWQQPYLNGSIAFKLVDGIDDAIAWVNQHSSGHADTIITESYRESRQFATQVNSATIYINASPRFYRYHPEGSPVALGMSGQRGNRRGFIGLEALTSIKRVVQGNGEI